MPEITAWSLVIASFLLIGVFGYASVGRAPQTTTFKIGRPIIMIIAAVVSANYLNTAAYRIFTRIEIDTFKRYGSIQEDQMQPDMPNLMAGLILFGWISFIAGVVVSRLIKAHTKNHESESGSREVLTPGPHTTDRTGP
jgi:hypothetical protein